MGAQPRCTGKFLDLRKPEKSSKTHQKPAALVSEQD